MLDFVRQRRTPLLRALIAWLMVACCALIASAQAPETPRAPRRLQQLALPPNQRAKLAEAEHRELTQAEGPFVEEEPDWLPNWTLPHPDMWEQLWRPGDLIDDSYWLRRPWSAGFFFGTMDGDQLSTGVDQQSDWCYGFRFGNDFAPHWGWEARSLFFSPDLSFAPGLGLGGQANDWFLDLSVLHYPWGDTRIRPFWSVGLGAAQFKFQDELGSRISEWIVDVPLAIGCKYYHAPWLVLRGELGDTVCFGNENVDMLNNLSFTVGAEIHWHAFRTRPVKYGY